jgi:hypothetical protein
MKTIEYQPIGAEVFCDTDCETHARAFLTSEGWDYIAVANELFITAARTLIAEGVFPNTEVEFKFQGKIMTVYPNGSLDHWPVGFCDTNEILLSRMLNARMKRVKL